MASVFTSIMRGELPGRFVWEDDRCVAFLTIEPVALGHTLVVPREEVADWMQASPDLVAHLTTVAHTIGQAQQAIWGTPKVGLLAEGFAVEHLHLHVFPAASTATFDFTHHPPVPEPDQMDEAAARIREQLRVSGHGVHVSEGPSSAGS